MVILVQWSCPSRRKVSLAGWEWNKQMWHDDRNNTAWQDVYGILMFPVSAGKYKRSWHHKCKTSHWHPLNAHPFNSSWRGASHLIWICFFLFFFVIDDLLFLYSPESDENVFFFFLFWSRLWSFQPVIVPLPEPTPTQGPAPPGFTRRHVARGEWSIA